MIIARLADLALRRKLVKQAAALQLPNVHLRRLVCRIRRFRGHNPIIRAQVNHPPRKPVPPIV